MKRFFERYSYDVVKTFAFHLVISFFGLTVFSLLGQSTALKAVLTALILFFHMFLLYGEIWKIGSRDAAAGVKSSMLTGLYIGICGSAIDWILALLKFIVSLNIAKLEKLDGGLIVVNFVYNGMYRGILNWEVAGQDLGSHPWFYLLAAVPTLIACTLGYYLGRKEKHLTKLFVDENPEEKEIKREEKKRRKGESDDR